MPKESIVMHQENHLEKIADRLKSVLQESKKNNESTDLVARRIAWKRINS